MRSAATRKMGWQNSLGSPIAYLVDIITENVVIIVMSIKLLLYVMLFPIAVWGGIDPNGRITIGNIDQNGNIAIHNDATEKASFGEVKSYELFESLYYNERDTPTFLLKTNVITTYHIVGRIYFDPFLNKLYFTDVRTNQFKGIKYKPYFKLIFVGYK